MERSFAARDQTHLDASATRANDLTVLLTNETSRKGRFVINKMNNEMRNHQERTMIAGLEREDSGFLSRLEGGGGLNHNRSSMALQRNAQNILVMSGDNFNKPSMMDQNATMLTLNNRSGIATPQLMNPNQSALNLTRGNLNRSNTSGFARPPSTRDLIPALHPQPLPALRTSSALDPVAALNPNILNESDRLEIINKFKKDADVAKTKKVAEYIDSVVKKIEDMDEQAKNFKNYDKAILDKKDEEIRKWVVTQKKVDEERRVEVEARLRLIFQDKIYEGTDYSPSEGFLLSMDFM